MDSKELFHHGVKGQQWGVKHGPPYPIDENDHPVYLKKGVHFKRLSVNDESMATGHAYVNYLEDDIEHYRGFFGARLKALNGGKDVYSVDMVAKKDLVSPSKSERVKTFIELYSNDPQIAKELGRYHKTDIKKSGISSLLPTFIHEYRYSHLSPEELKVKGYETFVRSIGGVPYVRDAYFKALEKKGYDFVTDDMDAGRFGEDPSIIFDRNKSVQYLGQQKVSSKEIYDTWKRRGTYYN